MHNIVLFSVFVAFTHGAVNEAQRLEKIEGVLLQLQEANQKQNDVNQQLWQENNRLKLLYETLLSNQRQCIEYLHVQVAQRDTKTVPYNTTIEELEIRIDRLEEDMFEAEVDIESLQFSLQETIETVMDHSDNLDQIEQDITDLEAITGTLENRTSDIEENIVVLETSLEGLDVRTTDIEEILSEARNSAFLAALSTSTDFEGTFQTIIFDIEKINEGGHYNTTTGKYTVPVPGIYEVFAYIRANPKASFEINIDDTRYVLPIEDGDDGDGTQGEGTSVTVKLQAGQSVQVLTNNVACTVHGFSDGHMSWFGGHLLFPESA